MTTSPTNSKASIPASAGNAIYRAQGTLETLQETIIATRNAEIVQTNVNQDRSITNTSTTTRIIQNKIHQEEQKVTPVTYENLSPYYPGAPEGSTEPGGIPEQIAEIFNSHVQNFIATNNTKALGGTVFNAGAPPTYSSSPGPFDFSANQFSSSSSGFCFFDPLAQSFLVTETGGCFVTKVDIFFAQKDTTGLPVWVEIRNMVKGYPGPKLIPFGRKVLVPDDVNVDDDTASAC